MKRTLILLMALLVVAVSVFLLLRKRPDETIASPAAAPSAPQRTPLEGEVALPVPSKTVAPVVENAPAYPAFATLPPGTPVAELYLALVERADRGDPYANCRLALAIDACSATGNPNARLLSGMVGAMAEMEGQPDRQGQLVDAIAAAQERDAIASAQCAGVDALSERTGERRAREAAERGTHRMRVLFAMRAPSGRLIRLMPQDGVTVAPGGETPIVAQYYADHAFAFLEAAYDARDPLAIEGLILVYAPRPLLRPDDMPLRAPNPYNFTVLAGLYERLGGPLPSDVVEQRDAITQTMSADERARLQQSIDQEAHAWAAVQPDIKALGSRPDPDALCRGG